MSTEATELILVLSSHSVMRYDNSGKIPYTENSQFVRVRNATTSYHSTNLYISVIINFLQAILGSKYKENSFFVK